MTRYIGEVIEWCSDFFAGLRRKLPICDRCKRKIIDGQVRTVSSAGWTVHTMAKDCRP